MKKTKTFAEIHEEGAERYGANWLVVNQHVKDTAQWYGLDIEDAQIKLALSGISLKMLRVFGTAECNRAS